MLSWYLIFFIGSGDFYCLHSETIGDVTYTIVWNNDTTVSGTTYRSTCLVRSGYSHSYGQPIVWLNEYLLFVEITTISQLWSIFAGFFFQISLLQVKRYTMIYIINVSYFYLLGNIIHWRQKSCFLITFFLTLCYFVGYPDLRFCIVCDRVPWIL